MKYKGLLFDTDRKAKIIQRNAKDLEPQDGEIIIAAEYSGINYKDALGVLDQSPIFKTHPIIPGIDVAGKVWRSKSKLFKEGDAVLVNGMGLGEDKDGGYSQFVKVPEAIVVKSPKGLSARQAMALGTAGFTAALAVDRMLTNGQTFEKGPILVSGATGGVGSFAIQILSQLGFFVEAMTSRPELYTSYLEDLGAHLVSTPKDVMKGEGVAVAPLAKAQWGGAVDNIGGRFLESILPSIELWGNVASIGLAQSSNFSTTVMPFILRGVSLLGASSNNCEKSKRDELWQLLATEWRPQLLEELITSEVSLEQIPQACEKILKHQNHGRVLVNLKDH